MGDRLGSNGPVVVTGATGFLGKTVLAELIAGGDIEVIALVRATSRSDAERRGAETLAAALDRLPTATERRRVHWVRADIIETRLGLGDAAWRDLAGRTGDIIHCAASVKFDLPLPEAQRINVDGTANLLELATEAMWHGGFGCFHHVSTAYAAGMASGPVDADHLPGDRAGNFRNNYERTKARAERLLRSQQDVPIAIYRPSIVGGRTDTGRTDNWNVLYAPMRMMANGQLPMVPGSCGAPLDTVGVDYVARGLVHLAGTDRRGTVGHHLTAGRAFTVGQLVATTGRISRLFDRTPSEVRLLGPGRWRLVTAAIRLAARAPRWAGDIQRWGRLADRGLRTVTPYTPYTEVGCRFHNRRERAVLEDAGIMMPAAATYLETIVSFAVGTDFGRTPIVDRSAPFPTVGS